MNVKDQEIHELLEKSHRMIVSQEDRRDHRNRLQERITTMRAEIADKQELLDRMIRASTLVGNVSDTNIKTTLEMITGVINNSLTVIFPEDPRRINITHTMYRNVHPHFNVILETGHQRRKRTFKMSGSGLGQIVSFLFTLALLDVRKARPLIIMDELLNGLHPEAKALIRDLMKAVSNRFQFVIVEYMQDVGKQYEAKKLGETSSVTHYPSGKYYMDMMEKRLLEPESRE